MWLLRLIRLPNLAIVALTQYLLYYLLLRPLLQEAGVIPLLNAFYLHLLITDTLLITAGGYLINDIIDRPIDLINRREKVVIGRQIAESTAYWLYFLFTLIGFGLAFFLAIQLDKLGWLWIYPLAVCGLYFYSHSLKRLLLVGNFLVAVYCAGVAGILWIAEWNGIQAAIAQAPAAASRTLEIFCWYLVFAFLSTLFREIVKDIEDQQGDRDQQRLTAPIRWGVSYAVRLAALPAVLLLAALLMLTWRFYAELPPSTLVFLAGAIGLPVMFTLWRLFRARSRRDFHQVSQLAKVVMLSGIFLLLFLTGFIK